MCVTESELITLQRASAIRGVHVRSTDAGGLCVSFEVGAQTATLMISRNEVRYWGRLNRLANWLKELDMCSWNVDAARQCCAENAGSDRQHRRQLRQSADFFCDTHSSEAVGGDIDILSNAS